MRIQFPFIVCLLGGLYSLYFALKLRKFKVPDQPPKSRAHLSKEEREKKMQLASWLCLFIGLLMIATAAYFYWSNISG